MNKLFIRKKKPKEEEAKRNKQLYISFTNGERLIGADLDADGTRRHVDAQRHEGVERVAGAQTAVLVAAPHVERAVAERHRRAVEAAVDGDGVLGLRVLYFRIAAEYGRRYLGRLGELAVRRSFAQQAEAPRPHAPIGVYGQTVCARGGHLEHWSAHIGGQLQMHGLANLRLERAAHAQLLVLVVAPAEELAGRAQREHEVALGRHLLDAHVVLGQVATDWSRSRVHRVDAAAELTVGRPAARQHASLARHQAAVILTGLDRDDAVVRLERLGDMLAHVLNDRRIAEALLVVDERPSALAVHVAAERDEALVGEHERVRAAARDVQYAELFFFFAAAAVERQIDVHRLNDVLEWLAGGGGAVSPAALQVHADLRVRVHAGAEEVVALELLGVRDGDEREAVAARHMRHLGVHPVHPAQAPRRALLDDVGELGAGERLDELRLAECAQARVAPHVQAPLAARHHRLGEREHGHVLRLDGRLARLMLAERRLRRMHASLLHRH